MDFGARIYDGRIGRWLSVDPLDKKYHSLSPYNFANNNPIINIDFDGMDWKISIVTDNAGNRVVTLKLTAAVVNNSANKTLDMATFAKNVKSQIVDVYSVQYDKTQPIPFRTGDDLRKKPGPLDTRTVNTLFKVEVDIRVISDQKELNKDEHLFSIDPYLHFRQQDSPEAAGFVNRIGGKHISILESIAQGVIENTDKSVISHEVGHTLGLRHTDVKYADSWDEFFGNKDANYIENVNDRENNLMQSENKGKTGLTIKQMEKIISNLKKGRPNVNAGSGTDNKND